MISFSAAAASCSFSGRTSGGVGIIVVERGDDYQTIPKTRHYYMNGQLKSEEWSEYVLGPNGLLYRSYSCDGNIEYEQRLDPDGVFRATDY